MLALISALAVALVVIRGYKPAVLLVILSIGGYAIDLIEYSMLVALIGAIGVGSVIARGVAPTVAAITLFIFLSAHAILIDALDYADWSLIDFTRLMVEINLEMSIGLLLAIAAAALGKYARVNWFHITYSLLVVSAAAPAAFLLSGAESASAVTALSTAALMLLIPLGSHVLALKLRSLDVARQAGSRACRLPYPVELRRQLVLLRRTARARRKELQLGGSADENHSSPVPTPQHTPSSTRTSTPRAKARAPAAARVHAWLKEYQARYTTLVENAPHAVLFTDLDGKILSANRAARRILGFSASSLIGSDIKRLIPPDSRTNHPLHLQLVIKAPGETISIHQDAEVLRRNGESVRTAIYIDEVSGGRISKYAIQILPTDEVERAEKLLQKARSAAHRGREARIETLAAMSHELRTPLHGLIATLDMLRDEALSADGVRQLSVAKTSAKSLLNLVNDVLDIARMEGPNFPLTSERFNLGTLLSETVAEFAARAAAKGLELRRDIDANLPRSHIGDRQRVKQIVSNLISNAINFTSYGGISLVVRRENGTIVIDVSDTGPGVPHNRIKAIFQPFVRIKTESSASSGTGLGLPISRQLCRVMGGDLVLLKTSAAGSTFRATLKLEESDQDAPEEYSNKIYTNPAGRILVVEDHEINQYVVKAMLDSLGCSVQIASDGNQALKALQEQTFDLVLMDCRMPGLDGYQATRRAKEHLKVQAPIIAMTANASQEERSECIDAGMDDFIAKPFGRAELSRILCKWLDPSVKNTPPSRFEPIALDENVFDELWESLHWNGSAMRSIHETFLQTLDRSARSILARGDGDIERQLHTLIGTSGMVGAREVSRVATRIKESYNSGRSDELSALVTQLRAASKAFSHAFIGRLEEKLGHANDKRPHT